MFGDALHCILFESGGKQLKAIDIHNHFISCADWINPECTVDKIILGDPNKEIHRVLVTWISSFHAIRTAVEQHFDMIITHEPTFWNHNNEQEEMDKGELGLAKKKYILESGLVILRCHDVWDKMPEIGIPWAWARFLGLGKTPKAIDRSETQHRYDIGPVTLDVLAGMIAEKTAILGEPFIQVIGNSHQIVSKVGIGTGCGCDIATFQKMGCDVSIVCDDGSCYWSNISRATDGNHPVLRVNHGTSEEPGMVTLTEYVNTHFSEVNAVHIPHGSCFRLISARQPGTTKQHQQ